MVCQGRDKKDDPKRSEGDLEQYRLNVISNFLIFLDLPGLLNVFEIITN